VLERAREMRTMHARCSYQHIDAGARWIVRQLLARTHEPKRWRPAQRFRLDASEQILNAVAGITCAGRALGQHPMQERALH
jgi:hypothetical protein